MKKKNTVKEFIIDQFDGKRQNYFNKYLLKQIILLYKTDVNIEKIR